MFLRLAHLEALSDAMDVYVDRIIHMQRCKYEPFPSVSPTW